MNLSLPYNDGVWFAGRWFERSDGRFAILAVSGVMLVAGVVDGTPVLVGAGAAGLCLLGRMLEQVAFTPRSSKLAELATRLLDKCGRYNVSGSLPSEPPEKQPENRQPDPGPAIPESIESTGDLVEAMIATHRYALLLRPESATHLSDSQRRRAAGVLDERMAVVPAGEVLTGFAAERATLGQEAQSQPAGSEAVPVEACYLDRWAVTNAEFQQFVDAGGYEQLDLWPEEALPALFEFVDETGEPAPRYWSDGQHAPGDERLPVVGVSWYEAAAYATWVGKRLPTDAEWTKACAWPVESAPGRIAQRRYPWGESFEPRRANLWCSGQRRLAEVDDFAEGATVGGVEQMVGNAWEWSLTPLDEATPDSVRLPATLRCIRGGAFNTYFENQATCHFQSGEQPLARRNNIGVRLALSMSSLAG